MPAAEFPVGFNHEVHDRGVHRDVATREGIPVEQLAVFDISELTVRSDHLES
ncbi:hypothetical protein [Mycolicibacterium helvum]|uniref:Uncharacterized protein n=1 Tax=Mycolicibacterium helvum TaxID=1534349 RepID=A0A7I7TBU5_9MYCO|nr:hypothetical protein [Mycolicibacterium helvum]BBY65919.1 hypothetical protein MHEL_41620 [Mycolicibacterium helvum]